MHPNSSLLHSVHLAFFWLAISCILYSAVMILARTGSDKLKPLSSEAGTGTRHWAMTFRLLVMRFPGYVAKRVTTSLDMIAAATSNAAPALLMVTVVVVGPMVLLVRSRSVPPGDWIVERRAPPIPVTEERDLAVVEVNGDWRFSFQRVDQDRQLVSGTEFTVDVCRDYPSPRTDFPVGTILNRVIHTEETGPGGLCWSLNPDKHCGFIKRRYADRQPMMVMGLEN